MTKLIPFPALTIPLPCAFFRTRPYIAEANAMVPNGASTFLTKRTPTVIGRPANLPYKTPKNPPDWVIVENCALLSFIS